MSLQRIFVRVDSITDEWSAFYVPAGARFVHVESVGDPEVYLIFQGVDAPTAGDWTEVDRYLIRNAYNSPTELLTVGTDAIHHGSAAFWLHKVGTEIVKPATGGGVEIVPLNIAYVPPVV